MTTDKIYDVIIIGGSYAGLSAAMALGRSLRHVLIIDAGEPCNRQTPHSHNFLTRDGDTPAAIAHIGKEQVLKYDTVAWLHGSVTETIKTTGGFLVETAAGEKFTAARLVLATGIKDEIPPIPGFAACWGISVIHCPYCHGYEMRNKKTGILANTDRAFHLAGLVRNLTSDLCIFSSQEDAFSGGQQAILQRHNIETIAAGIAAIEHNEGRMHAVVLSDGRRLQLEALYAALPFTQQGNIAASLGCELTETGHIKIDAFQKTTVAGVYACGDNASMMRSVANAVYSGNVVGSMVNKELTDESFH